MNGAHIRDLLNSLEAQGADISKVEIRVLVKGTTKDDAIFFYGTNGTMHINIDKDSTGTITIEAERD